ncbi:MAG: hypothetical protein IPH76_18940 [Xanthomonadales bacterium]|nr:hypothetical protein [Xanthomonadales bacterium]
MIQVKAVNAEAVEPWGFATIAIQTGRVLAESRYAHPSPTLRVLALTVGTGVTAASLLGTSDVPAGETFLFGAPKSVLACSNPVWPGAPGTH